MEASLFQIATTLVGYGYSASKTCSDNRLVGMYYQLRELH